MAKGRSAFSLIELLVVIAIMLIMLGFSVPAFNSLKGNGDMKKAAYDISGLFGQARAYAMGNNTYVFVGIAEVDASIPASTTPQSAASTSAGGRVAIAIVASKDGTKHYADAMAGQGGDWQANYASSAKPEYKGGHLIAVGKLQVFENLHLVGSLPSTSGGHMFRPTLQSNNYMIGHTACISQTPFTWPLGSLLASGYQYRFDKVIQFDPNGTARIIYAAGGDSIPQWIEAGLQQAHGSTIPPAPTAGEGNQVAIQINGVTGANYLYRP